VKNIGFWHPILGLSEKNIFHPLIQREIFAVLNPLYSVKISGICRGIFEKFLKNIFLKASTPYMKREF